ncbi:uncharacterized protein B0P05DRAFT_592538 [Gilbertella persicaria]|uniref:uncharacterized protein n=1 Tax=Gilbertella persicaria TaxID=101096 RepID=UPI0022200548|nr:uncharacterized protein B0P05DRAFT_592538 [Gilbertella persicaria]KAI8047664.1 hypothetical protein B0P05DRAFT_592538 [Gilbertella persicaria]
MPIPREQTGKSQQQQQKQQQQQQQQTRCYLHLRAIHLIKTPKSIKETIIKQPKLTSDPNGLNHYCCVCERTYRSGVFLQGHINSCHELRLGNIKQTMIKHPDLQPDKSDPTSYCRACDIKFCDWETYKEYLRLIHDMYLLKRPCIKYPDKTPDSEDPNFYCCACDIKYMMQCSFR